ncbi:MAG TPA: CPBP family intramembrane glutamic endopeptidase, partial [Anaerolineales bacterium]|nr:CPBP family intramembrane glutamic endopeptidase [Anaerolineales bacterium]
PALANVATRLITREGWRHLWLWPNFRHGWRYYLAAILLPFLASVAAGTIFYLVFPGSFDPTLAKVRELYAAYSVAADTNPWVAFGIIILLASIRWLLQNGLASIGEEFGWRAYLLPKLMARFTGAEPADGSAVNPVPARLYASGARKASVWIGLIWGVWHWPLYLMGLPLTPDFPLLYLLVYPVSTCCMSVLLCWVTLRSGSVWPASIGHGFINGTSGIPMMPLKGPANMLLGPGPGGVIGVLGYLALALVLLIHRRAFTAGGQAGSPESEAAGRLLPG